MVTLIRHIEEKGTHFRGQQVGRCGPVEVAILLRESAVAKSTPAQWVTGKRVLVNSAGNDIVHELFFT